MQPDYILVKRPGKFHSPLRYPGGKAILASFLFDIIEENEIAGCTYVEPFAGGAGAALTLLFQEKVERIVINDLDKAIYSFWLSVLNESERFIEKIHSVALDVSEWRIQREIYLSSNPSIFELGFATFYLNRTNRSGIVGGRPIGGLEQTGKWKIGARFHRVNLAARIKKIAQYRNRIDIYNMHGISLMQKLIQSDDTLFYVDPPYIEKGNTLYFSQFEMSDHECLASYLNAHSNSRWILTYDNAPEVQNLYKDRQRYEFGLYYHTNKPKRCTEVLIKSDSLTMAN